MSNSSAIALKLYGRSVGELLHFRVRTPGMEIVHAQCIVKSTSEVLTMRIKSDGRAGMLEQIKTKHNICMENEFTNYPLLSKLYVIYKDTLVLICHKTSCSFRKLSNLFITTL